MKTINEILRNAQILIYQENNIWIAQCIEYDFATQGARMQDAIDALERIILGQAVLDAGDGIEPLSEILPAPISIRRTL